MDPDSTAQSPAKKIALGVGALLLLAAIGGIVWWQLIGRYPRELVTTPADPEWPSSLAGMNLWYIEPPPGQNAADYFLNGFAALDITKEDRDSTNLPLMDSKAKLPPLGKPFSDAARKEIAAFDAKNQEAWEIFRKGAKFEQARYPINLNDGPATVLPHLAKFRELAQISGVIALLDAENGKPDAAADMLLEAIAVGQSLKYEPIIVSQYVRAAFLARDLTNLEYVVNAITLPQGDLERLASVLAKAEAEESAGTAYSRGLAGERAMLTSLSNLTPRQRAKELANYGPIQNSGVDDFPSSMSLKWRWDDQRAFAEETLNRTLTIRKQPFPQRLKAKDYFDERMKEAAQKRFGFVTAILPALSTLETKEAVGLSDLRLMQTGIALERFRGAHQNQYPERLDELSPKYLPAVPQNPFDGTPLKYERKGSGYELTVNRPPDKPLTFKVIQPPK